MKILVINWQDVRNPLAGGAEVQFQEVFSRLAARGHEVTLFCSSFPGAAREEIIGGVRVVREGGRAMFNYVVPGAYERMFKNSGFDVVVEDLNKIPFFTPFFVKEPLCGIVHHLFGSSIYGEADPLSATYVSLMERLALALYRQRRMPFMVVSPSTRDEMLRRGFAPETLTLTPLAVDHQLYTPDAGARSPEPLIGYCGRIKKYKCIDHLLQALPAIRRSVPNVRAVIVGEGDDRPRLEQLARRLGVADRVTFAGFVSNEEKVRRLRAMWVMVMPSTKEGWGLTVTEANACGTPAVASDVQGLRDAVKDGETGMLFPHGNIAALEQAVVGLLNDPRRRSAMAGAALQFAGTFTWDRAADVTEELLQFQNSHATSSRISRSNPG